MSKLRRYVFLSEVVLIGSLVAGVASGQSTQPAVFVSNNGNLEGSVSAFRINGDGTVTFLNKQVIGTRTNINNPCSGCNAYEISISPNGRWLATCHPAGSIDGLSVLEIAPGGTVSLRVNLNIGDAGNLDVSWLDNEYVATVCTTPASVRVYHWDSVANSLTLLQAYPLGVFPTYLAVDSAHTHLYVGDSSGFQLTAYQIGAAGALSLVDAEPTSPTYPLGPAVSPNGSWLYAASGISNGSNKVLGFAIAGDGSLSPLAGSPFTSPETTANRCAVTENSAFLIVGHSNSAARIFSLDANGVPTDTGNRFVVGIQGDLGGIATRGNLLFLTRNSSTPTGLYSLTIGNNNGSLTQNGTLQSTTGIAPRGIEVWIPIPPRGDMNCDLVVDALDVPLFVDALLDPAFVPPGGCSVMNADMNQDLLINGDDTELFIDALL